MNDFISILINILSYDTQTCTFNKYENGYWYFSGKAYNENYEYRVTTHKFGLIAEYLSNDKKWHYNGLITVDEL